MSAATANRLGQVLKIWQLAAAGGIGKVGRELIQLVRTGRIPIRGIGVGSGLQICRNLLRYLLILAGIGLLKGLQFAKYFG